MTLPRLLLAISVAIVAVGCTGSDRRLEQRIAQAAQDGVIVRVDALTDFVWERLHIFPPYSSQAQINQELGFEWPAAARTGIFESDGITLLVFVHAGAVVRHVVQPRHTGDFADVKSPGGLTPRDAIFAVHRRVFTRVSDAEAGRPGSGSS